MDLFPGRIQRLLSDACWNEYHLTLLQSEASELIISDDLHVLQILSCLELAIEGSDLVGAIQSDTGRIAIAWRAELIVLEALDLYGKLPRWSLYYRDSLISDCQSITWLNREMICMNSIDGRVSLYDISQKQVVWELNVGYAYTGSFPGTQRAFSYSPGKSSSILVYCPSVGTQRKLKKRAVEYTTNDHLIKNAWFITSALLVAQTEQACFVWDTETSRLILSMPFTGAAVPVLFRTGEYSLTVRNNDHQCCLTLDGGTPHIEQKSPTENPLQLPGLRVGASGRRFYVTDQGSLRIYSLVDKEMKTKGFIGGASPSPYLELNTIGGYALAGSTLLTSDGSIILNLNSEIGLHKVLLSHFIDTRRLIALEVAPTRKKLVFYELNGNTWSRQVEGEYCALGSRCSASKEIIYLLRKDGFCELYGLGGALIKTQSLSYSPLDQALIKNGMLLLVVSDRIELWDLDFLQDGPAWSAILGKHRVPNVIALSDDCNHICAAFDDSNGSSVLYWNTKKPLCYKTLTFKRSTVRSVDWSPSLKSFAILTDESIKIFGVTSSLRGLVSEITDSEIKISKFPLFASLFSGKSILRWKGDGQGFLLFNGKHILSVDPKSLISMDTNHHNATSDSTMSNDFIETCSKLSDPLPIYHPSILLLCLANLQPSLVLFIFQKLTTAIRLGDTNFDKRVVYLSSTLNIENLPAGNDEKRSFDSERKVKLLELLRDYDIYDLTKEDQGRLSKLVSASDALEKLDAFGSYALASFLISKAGLSSAVAWVYATSSTTKVQLLNLVQERILSAESSNRFLVWLDQDQLITSMEQYARKRFAEERDPTSVALYYLAHHNLSGLKALWRISSGHPEKEKTLNLLNQDFTVPRWRTAAHKNAYALLSKRRPEYAAAFFLLGDSLKDCCQVCVDRLNNLELAITVARVYDAGHTDGLNYLRTRYFPSPLGNEDEYSNTRWTQVWLDMMLGNKAGVLESILDFSDLDLTTAFVYHWLGGTFTDDVKANVRDTIETAAVPKVLGAQFMERLTEPCSPRGSEGSRETTNSDEETKRTDEGTYPEEWERSTRQLKEPPKNLQLEPDMSAFGF